MQWEDTLWSGDSFSETVAYLPHVKGPVMKGHLPCGDTFICNIEVSPEDGFYCMWNNCLSFIIKDRNLIPAYTSQLDTLGFQVEMAYWASYWKWHIGLLIENGRLGFLLEMTYWASNWKWHIGLPSRNGILGFLLEMTYWSSNWKWHIGLLIGNDILGF